MKDEKVARLIKEIRDGCLLAQAKVRAQAAKICRDVGKAIVDPGCKVAEMCAERIESMPLE